MSLHYVIDGYNVTKHACFNPPKHIKDTRFALQELIRINRLCGSLKNTVTIVFDGWPDSGCAFREGMGIDIIFSHDQSADQWIKRYLESKTNQKNTIVVSDDREIKSFARSCGAKVEGVEDFLRIEAKSKSALDYLSKKDSQKHDLNYTQAEQINRELKKIWLKE